MQLCADFGVPTERSPLQYKSVGHRWNRSLRLEVCMEAWSHRSLEQWVLEAGSSCRDRLPSVAEMWSLGDWNRNRCPSL